MSLFTSWTDKVLERFDQREEMSREELYRRFWAERGLSEEDVREVFDIIETEFEIPAGILRPDDRLAKLFVPPSTWNPVKWVYYQYIFGDKENWLDVRIAERLEEQDLVEEWGNAILTIDDYVRAWGGDPPEWDER